MKCIFIFFVIIYFDITYCTIDKKPQGNIEETLSTSQKAFAVDTTQQNVSIGCSARDLIILHRNKLLDRDFSSDIKLFSNLKKTFNVFSNSCLVVGIICPMISLFGKFFPGIDAPIVYMISILMNMAPPLLKTFVVYADDQLLLKERLQVLYYGNNIADFYKNIAISCENYNKKNAKDNGVIANTNQNLAIEQKQCQFNVLDKSCIKQKIDIDIEEMHSLSESARNKLYMRIKNNKDVHCESTERVLKVSALVKFLFYGGSMIHSTIPSLSDHFNQQDLLKKFGKDKIISSSLDAINLMAVPLLGWIPRYLTKLDANIDELLKTDILFLLYKRQSIDCEVNVQAKQDADKTSEPQTIEIAENVNIVDSDVSVVKETL